MIYPLRGHCEQVGHVAYRLDRYRAGRRLDLATTTPAALAAAALATLGADTSGYRRFDPGAAARAAAVIAETLTPTRSQRERGLAPSPAGSGSG